MTSETCNMILGFRNYASSLCGNMDDAEDIMQDIALQILKRKKDFEKLPKVEQRKYVVRSIRNRLIDRNRQRSAAKRDPKLFSRLPIGRTEPDVFSKIELKEVLEKLNGKKSTSAILMYAEGYTNREIGEILNKNINTVLGHCRYARIFLKNN